MAEGRRADVKIRLSENSMVLNINFIDLNMDAGIAMVEKI